MRITVEVADFHAGGEKAWSFFNTLAKFLP